MFIRTFVFQAFKIPTGSMEENLLIGDHLIVNKMLYTNAPSALEEGLAPVRNVRRHDIVVFKFPGEPERDFIKRVIGLPGERLTFRTRRSISTASRSTNLMSISASRQVLPRSGSSPTRAAITCRRSSFRKAIIS